MNKQTNFMIMTHLRWGAFFLVPRCSSVIRCDPPRTWAARDASKRSSDVEIPLAETATTAFRQPKPPVSPGQRDLTPTPINTGRRLHTATLLAQRD